MATPIQVIYGTEVDVTVDGDLTPEQIIADRKSVV